MSDTKTDPRPLTLAESRALDALVKWQQVHAARRLDPKNRHVRSIARAADRALHVAAIAVVAEREVHNG